MEDREKVLRRNLQEAQKEMSKPTDIGGMLNLETLLVGLFPQNTIKVDVENDGKIVVNVDDKELKIKLPEIDPFHKIMYPDVDFSIKYAQLIVDVIKNQLNSKQ